MGQFRRPTGRINDGRLAQFVLELSRGRLTLNQPAKTKSNFYLGPRAEKDVFAWLRLKNV
jgi:hypothetical protein